MKLIEAIQNADYIHIEGPKKIGKLTFALYSNALINHNKNLLLTSFPKEIFKKRIESILQLEDPILSPYIKKSLEYYSLKPNFRELKLKYGFDFLFKDIEKMIEEMQPQSLIFHRLDLVFELTEKEMAKDFFDLLLQKCKNEHIKLFTTLALGEEGHHFLNEILENLTDLDLQFNEDRDFEIKNSLFPVEEKEYRFSFENSKLQIKAKDQSTTIRAKVILLITQDPHFIELNRYIFAQQEEQKYQLIVAKNLSEALSAILSAPDITVYDQKDQENLDLELCHTIAAHKFPTKALIIFNKNYIRYEERLKIIDTGCFELLPKEFYFLEYLYSLQKALNLNFYQKRLQQLPKREKYTEKKEEFCSYIQTLQQQGIFFTLIKAKSNEREHINASIREGDLHFFDGQQSWIVVLNIRAKNATSLLTKLQLPTEDVEIVECIDSQSIQRICQ